MGFQSTVNRDPAPAVAGDFASQNPRKTLDAGPGGLIAGPAGVTLGLFAWADGNQVVTNAKPGSGVARRGFVSRQGQAGVLITAFLGETSNLIQPGMGVTLHTDADFWGLFAAGATIGHKVFAVTADGTLKSAAAGATVAGAEETDFFVVTTAAAGEIAKFSQEG